MYNIITVIHLINFTLAIISGNIEFEILIFYFIFLQALIIKYGCCTKFYPTPWSSSDLHITDGKNSKDSNFLIYFYKEMKCIICQYLSSAVVNFPHKK